MSKQRSLFKGIDTFSITNFRDFIFISVLFYESESRSISMKPDINYLLSKIQIERYLSIDVVNAMREREKFLHPDLSKFDDHLTGSTYLPFDGAMLTQSLLVYHSPLIRVVLEDNHNGNNTNPEKYDCGRN